MSLRSAMHCRRGAVAVLSVFLMVMFCAIVALSIDIGYMMLVRTQLQVAVDSAALAGACVVDQSHDAVVAEAIRYGRMHRVGGQPLELSPSDISIGVWEDESHQFRETEVANAVLVRPTITRRLFFAGIFGNYQFTTDTQGSAALDAIATANPRDIAFVVDLSGWGNAVSELAQADGKFNSLADMNEHLADLYQDFGIDPAEVRMESLGAPLGAKKNPMTELTKVGGLLAGTGIPERYRIHPDDSEELRVRKGYLWVIEQQIAYLMPKAIPNPADIANYDYWVEYVDYLIEENAIPAPATPLIGRGRWSLIPPGHLRRQQRIAGFQNDKKSAEKLRNQVSYASYFQFMLDVGRDSNVAGRYAAISALSGESPLQRETTAAGDFMFPPRTQPMHSIRRALIAAAEMLRSRGTSGTGRSMGDQISLITFDRAIDRDPNTPGLAIELTDDYKSVMQACAQLQACGDNSETTSTDAGLRSAWEHLLPEEQGGRGRSNSKKIVLLITVGKPDACASSPGQIEAYMATHPNKQFYGDGRYPEDAALMYAHKMREREWQVIPIGVGPNADYKFIERMAKLTDAYGNQKPPKFDKSPEELEDVLPKLLSQALVTSPNLVQ